jgi:ribonuclease J
MIDFLQVTPFGGVQEIGSNMTLVETQEVAIVIDCGILFPRDDLFGIDYLIPDFTQVPIEKLKALVITHGHEDHIGAIPHFCQSFPDIPIFCTHFTYELILNKLEQFKMRHPLIKVNIDDTLEFGTLKIDYIHVNHSIPHTYGLLIRHLNTCAFYASDFKIDLTKNYENTFDFDKLKKLTVNSKKLIGFIDSTNILDKEKTPEEFQLKSEIDKILQKDHKRIYVTLFSSNIWRVKTLIDLAKKNGRTLILSGASVKRYCKVAVDTNVIDDFSYFDEDQINQFSGKVLILISGCQGDFFGSLRRYASGEHAHLKPILGDLVVFSSKIIPGNERTVFQIYNSLAEKGVEIITAHQNKIHASGHPGQADLKILYNEIKFTDLIPIHGESLFLVKHKEFIQQNFSQISPWLIYNYDSININQNGIKVIKKYTPSKPVIIGDGKKVIEKSDISLRRKIATAGLIIIKTENKTILDFSFHGITATNLKSNQYICDKLNKLCHIEILKNAKVDPLETIRITSRQYFTNIIGYRPHIIVC